MYQIIQNYCWIDSRTGKPMCPLEDNIIIATFTSKWRARLYKWWHYDNAQPAWRTSFSWKIVEIK